ncbi:MAG: hypothetical protein ACLSAF_16950 [Intestinimonas sp.]
MTAYKAAYGAIRSGTTIRLLHGHQRWLLCWNGGAVSASIGYLEWNWRYFGDRVVCDNNHKERFFMPLDGRFGEASELSSASSMTAIFKTAGNLSTAVLIGNDNTTATAASTRMPVPTFTAAHF